MAEDTILTMYGHAYEDLTDGSDQTPVSKSAWSCGFDIEDVWSGCADTVGTPDQPSEWATTCSQGFFPGVHIDSIFDSDSEKQETSPTPTTSSQKLGQVSFDEICQMHPNKIWLLVLDYILPRYGDVQPRKRIGRDKKQKATLDDIIAAVKSQPMSRLVECRLNHKARWHAQLALITWMARFLGMSVRDTRKVVLPQFSKGGYWSTMDDKVKSRFVFLWSLGQDEKFKQLFPEFATRRNGQTTCINLPVKETVAADIEEQHTVSCFGFLATYNTKIGLQDPDILRWLQEGLRGTDLQDRMKSHPLLAACFQRFAQHIKDVAESLKFPVWAVSMEHGNNSKHPGRVHFHAAAGVDISRGVGYMGIPKPTLVKRADLFWEGSDAPHVKWTNFKRATPNLIYNAVATAMYYVAGPKIGSLFVEASVYPMKAPSHTQLVCLHEDSLCLRQFGQVTHHVLGPCVVTECLHLGCQVCDSAAAFLQERGPS